jgi:hypothetical protein
MTTKITGTVKYQDLGVGTWSLVTPNQTYELKDAPPSLRKEGLKVEVEGIIRDDMVTIAMIGPVLEVKSFNLD